MLHPPQRPPTVTIRRRHHADFVELKSDGLAELDRRHSHKYDFLVRERGRLARMARFNGGFSMRLGTFLVATTSVVALSALGSACSSSGGSTGAGGTAGTAAGAAGKGGSFAGSSGSGGSGAVGASGGKGGVGASGGFSGSSGTGGVGASGGTAGGGNCDPGTALGATCQQINFDEDPASMGMGPCSTCMRTSCCTPVNTCFASPACAGLSFR